jgi:hypothetical protein
MAGEAVRVRDANDSYVRVGAITDVGEIIQVPTGEAAWLDDSDPVSSGVYTAELRTGHKATVKKSSSVVFVPGQQVWWDHSANEATYAPSNDRDFYLGIATKDSTSGETTVEVDIGKKPVKVLDAVGGAILSDTAGTAAAGGFGAAQSYGGSQRLRLTSTNEAQKVALWTVDRRAVAANLMIAGCFRVAENGGAGNADFSIGAANGDHATDADSIAESVFLHIDSNTLDIYAESDDGTTEVVATDTAINFTEGSAVSNRVYFVMDFRDPSDVQIYINGAQVLAATTFNIGAATGPLGLLAHLEKTATTETFDVYIDELYAWTAEN